MSRQPIVSSNRNRSANRIATLSTTPIKLLSSFLLLLACQGELLASVTVYHDEATFLAANDIVSTETFDEFPTVTTFSSPVTIDSVNYETTIPGVFRAGINFGGTVSSPNDFGSNRIAEDFLTFGAGGYVHGVGFWFGGLSGGLPVPHWEILVEETDGNIATEDVPDMTFPKYFGFSSPLGINMVTLHIFGGLGTGGSNWSIDNVSRTEIIPEPSTLVLLVLGLLGVGWLGRKNA